MSNTLYYVILERYISHVYFRENYASMTLKESRVRIKARGGHALTRVDDSK